MGTGYTLSVQEFLTEAFAYANLDWPKYVRIDPRHFHRLEVETLIADSSKVSEKLRWEARVTFGELARINGRRRHGSSGPETSRRGPESPFEVWNELS